MTATFRLNSSLRRAILGLACASVVWLPTTRNCRAYDPPMLHIESPVPYQVVQRTGFVSGRAHDHEPGGPALGYADVAIRGDLPDDAESRIEYRTVPFKGGLGQATDWAAADCGRAAEKRKITLRIPAGGWYRLEIRVVAGQRTLAAGSVEPFGVGEVFVIAGQSYAAGANDELQKIDDPAGRVTAYDSVRGTWGVAHDPQPAVGDGGTIWPAFANALLPVLRVPIGLVNVAVGGTASRQWLPGEKLFENLSQAGTATGRFRAVLWQQGESDVIEKVTTSGYVRNLTAIRGTLANAWGFEPTWLLAKSTLHPTVYNDPDGEGRIRLAIDELCRARGFRPGPDTDILAGEFRGGLGTRRHFSGSGQRQAGLLWFATVWNELNLGESSDPDGTPMKILHTKEGVRFGLWGETRSAPAPTLFVFATSLEAMAQAPVYSEVGRRLARHGFLYVALDPPCHGVDARPGEPPELRGWRDRAEKENDFIGDFTTRAKAVLDHLVAEGFTDASRVAACGNSRGGFLAYHFAAVEPRVKAVAGFSPVTNLTALTEFRGLEQHAGTGNLALVNHAAKLADRRIWLSIGNHDERVSTDDAIAFARRIVAESNGRPKNSGQAARVELIVGPSDGHTMIDDAHRLAAEWILRQLPRP